MNDNGASMNPGRNDADRVLLSTTDVLSGHFVKEYLGVVTAQEILTVSIFRDFVEAFRDLSGGRVVGYEEDFEKGTNGVLQTLRMKAGLKGADAVLGVSLDYERMGERGHILMVAATGTAVRLSKGSAACPYLEDAKI